MEFLPDLLMWLSWMVAYSVALFVGLLIVSVVMVGYSLCVMAARSEDR